MPAVRAAPGSTVELWWIELDQPLPADWTARLAPNEAARAERFANDRLRRRFANGRLAMRAILAGRLGRADPRALALGETSHGKPRLAEAGGPAFNLSHCEATAVLAVAPLNTIGVDLELARELGDQDALARQILSSDEHEQFDRLHADHRNRALLTAWTRKEACMKAWAAGLGIIDPAALTTGIEASRGTIVPPDRTLGSMLDLQTVVLPHAVLSIAGDPAPADLVMRHFDAAR